MNNADGDDKHAAADVEKQAAAAGLRILPVLASALLWLFLALVLLQSLTENMADFDLWWRMATGKLFFETGALPEQDPFSYLPTLRPWIQHGWLTNLLFYKLGQTGDSGAGLQLMRWGLIAGTVLCCWMAARLRGASLPVFAICLLLIKDVLSFGFPVIRAQEFTYFFFTLFICWLEYVRKSGRWPLTWLLAPLLWLWANLHPGFLAGGGVLFFYALGQWRTPRKGILLLAVGAVGALMTLLNPYGLDFWRQALLVSSTPSSEVTEWLPVWQTLFHGDRQAISRLFVGLLAGALLLATWFGVRCKRFDVSALLVLAVTAYLALQHNRHIVFFALAFAIYVPEMLQEALDRLKRSTLLRTRAPRLGALLLTFFFLFHFIAVPKFLGEYLLKHPGQVLYTGALTYSQVPRGVAYYPLESLYQLKRRGLQGRLATHVAWGGLMVWAAYPDCRIAFDGRNESVFTAAARKLFADFILARDGWRDFLVQHPTDLLILKPYSPIGKLMSNEPGWTVLYQGQGSMLLMKNQNPGTPH